LTLFGSSDLRYNLVQQVFAGLGFISNLYESSTGISYANSFAPHLFVHLWSLALEVQFYIVWGLVIWGLVKIFKRTGIKGQTFLLSALLFVISSLAMALSALTRSDFSLLYYSPLDHIFPFFLGAALAGLAGIHTTPLIRNTARRWTLRRIQINAAVAGLLLLLFSFLFHFNSQFTYLLGFMLAALTALVLIFNLRLLHERTKGEEPAVIRFVSDISYGVYIFHWPFLIIFENYNLPQPLAILLTVGLSVALSALMFYGVDPVLRGRRVLGRGALIASLIAVLFFLVPSSIALAQTSDQTTLAQSLWAGSNEQSAQQLAFSEKLVQTGAAGAKNLLIGDSVAMGTIYPYPNYPMLTTEIPETYIDAAGDRIIESSLEATLKADLTLMPANCAIVIALGTNSTSATKAIATLQQVIQTYSTKHHIVLVTPADWRSGGPFESDKIADWEVSIKDKYKNVTIADWRAASKGHPDYFDADGTHIADRPAGREKWISLVKQALAEKGN
jgi:peptidoglycan/LPS O-acetylase OafA/YrhL